MDAKHTKFANVHYVLDSLSVKEVALENGFELLTIDDIEILKNNETGEKLFLRKGKNSLDSFVDIDTGEEGNIMRFLEIHQEIINWDMLGYLEQKLGEKIYNHSYTHENKTNLLIDSPVVNFLEFPRRNTEDKEIEVSEPQVKEQGAQAQEQKEANDFDHETLHEAPTKEQADAIKEQEAQEAKDFSYELLHEKCKIPVDIIDSGLFPHSVGWCKDSLETCKELRFKLEGETQSKLILREQTDLKTGQIKNEVAYEGDKNAIWVANKKPNQDKNVARPIVLTSHPIDAMSIYALYPETSKGATFIAVATKDISEKSIMEINKLNSEINKGLDVRDNNNIRICCSNDIAGQLYGIETKCKLGGLRYVQKKGPLFFFLKDKEKSAPIDIAKDRNNNTLTLKCTLPNVDAKDKRFAIDALKQGLFGAKIDISENEKGVATITLKTNMDLALLKQLNNNLSELTGIYSDTSKSKRWNQDLQNSVNESLEHKEKIDIKNNVVIAV